MKLKGVAIREFAPFSQQFCIFGKGPKDADHGDVHLFVGQNGTGKTRLLSLLLGACGNPTELNDRRTDSCEALAVGTSGAGRDYIWVTNNHTWLIPNVEAASVAGAYISKGSVQAPGAQIINGSLPSIDATPAMAFMSVAAIRDEKITPMNAVPWGKPETQLTFSRQSNEGIALCQAVANMKIRTGMHMAANPGSAPDRTTSMTRRLEQTLTSITGRDFIFLPQQEGNELRLHVRWGGVTIRLHQLPDGLRAIIGWLVACVAKLDYLLQKDEKPLDHEVLLFLDEPESHLHPAWQRKVLPALQKLLPNAQIFVATHSPFVVSSVNHGWYYIFKASADGKVQIEGPKECPKGDSYIDAVEDILGVKEWYDPETESMLKKFRELRDRALKSEGPEDRDAAIEFAQQIAGRSESLNVMMGHELQQLQSKAQTSKH